MKKRLLVLFLFFIFIFFIINITEVNATQICFLGYCFDTCQCGDGSCSIKACGETCSTCPRDCGTCPCTPSWSCGAWGPCINYQQTRICTDSNGCGTTSGKPAESQSCTCIPTGSCSGYQCGVVSNGCGTILHCGDCDTTKCLTCSSGQCVSSCTGTQICAKGQCIASCTPNCKGRFCGPDGCGGSCGTCTGGYCSSSGNCCGANMINCDPGCTRTSYTDANGCTQYGCSCPTPPPVCKTSGSCTSNGECCSGYYCNGMTSMCESSTLCDPCVRNGYKCGEWISTCGGAHPVSCGTCDTTKCLTCSSGKCVSSCTGTQICSNGQCVTPTCYTCADYGYTCGTYTNNCGQTIYCGADCIQPPPTCTGSCKSNTCSSYSSCTSLTGTCSSGYCCTGSCTTITIGPYNISGYTLTSSNTAISSITIEAKIGSCPGSSALNTYTTNAQGYYFISSNNQALCLTPNKTSYTFQPSSYSASLSLTLTKQNFTGSLIPQCSLSDAYFAKSSNDNTIITSAVQGDIVNLIVKGNSNCNNKNVTFVIKEYDIGSSDDPVNINPNSATFSNSQAKTSWTAEWQDDGPLGGNPEYYFTAYEGSNSISSGTTDDRLLVVSKSGAEACGNGVINTGEDCDGSNLNSSTCASLSWSSGTLKCDASCHFDFNSCISNPCNNNNKKEKGEECDGSDLNSVTYCKEINSDYTSGNLSCANCLYNESNCKISSQCSYDCSKDNLCEPNCAFSSKCTEDPDCICSDYVEFGYSECTKDECLDGWDTSVYKNHGTNSGCCAIPTCYPSQCYSAWECSDWSTCENSKKTRTCTLKNTLSENCPQYSPDKEKSCLTEAEFPFFSPIQIIYVILLLIMFYGYKLKRKH